MPAWSAPRGISHGGAAVATCWRRSGGTPSGAPTTPRWRAFSAAFGRGDVDAIMALTTDDCVFEATGPAPGRRTPRGRGRDPRACGSELFGDTPDAAFIEEESFVHGDRGVLRWRFEWAGRGRRPGHVRGVDVLRLRDGKVCEKLSYVKG